jgi:predicted DNA-binding antitoxin AbrB/MazE fold protein
MSHKITAIYENGVLRPLTPLNLPDHTTVEIDVKQMAIVSTTKDMHSSRARQALIAAGVSIPKTKYQPNDFTLSAERREELARLFSSTQSLGELINEDREGR